LDIENDALKDTLFFFFICLVFLCEGGHFVLAPTIYAKLFGADGGIRVYSVGFSFIGLASLINILIIEYLLEILGFEGICYIYSILSAIALLILIFIF
jgi:hypothetical protein